jgi:serine protease Do
MLRKGWLLVLLLALLVSAGSLAAQDAAPTAVQPDGAPTFGAITLRGNFVLDPFVMSVIGGGLFPAADLSVDCVGYVPANPTLSLTLTGDPTENLRLFTYSDNDTVLVVRLPSGEFACNDDASALLIDSSVSIATAEPGVYSVWVGSYAENQLVSAFFVASHAADANAATFDVASLVDRQPPGEIDANLSSQLSAGLRTVTGAAITTSLDPAGEPQLFEDVVGGGGILAFEVDSRGFQCAGYVNGQPTLDVTVPEGAPALTVLFEATMDTTLVIVGPQGELYCNDDVIGGNLNPGVVIPSPEPGLYAVNVGTFDPAATATGRLLIAGSEEVAHAVLSVAPSGAGQ